MIRRGFSCGGRLLTLVTLAAAVTTGCNSHPLDPASPPVAPAAAPAPSATPRGQRSIFFDDFSSGDVPRWEPLAGRWDVAGSKGDRGGPSYGALPREFALTAAGGTQWRDYSVEAEITFRDDRMGPVGLAGRVQRSHHYFEVVFGRDPGGQGGAKRGWMIRQRVQHQWTTLASGGFDYETNRPYRVRFTLEGDELSAQISSDGGIKFFPLGGARVPTAAWRTGKFALVSYGGAASFDEVNVTGGDFVALEAPPWGAVVELRDNTATFGGRPSGGWYVTPIHATVRASDGKVLITGFGRQAEANCSGSTQREVGETWLLDPSSIDALNDGQTLFVTPLNEGNLDTTHHVLYCAGHNTLADGRVFFSAGTDYPNTLPDSSPERGLTYSRIFNPMSGTFTRIAANMAGGQAATRGEKWYPTNLLMGDGRVLIFGGFHWSAGGPGSKPNLSLEMFDPKLWDADHNANPYTVLTQHEEGQAETPPTRGYSNLFLLPKPVPAGSASGFARSVALAGGVGRVFLFNHEPGPTGAQRLVARTNALTPNPSGNEKGEGSSGVLLTDGTIMFANGGHDGVGSARVYFYNPYSDSWTTLDTGISRMYVDAVQLPTGQVLLINGYQGPGEPGNTTDITNPIGNMRQPTLVDPYATPRTATNLPAWPEPTHRGYHSISVLLKDGRVLVGGGKDADHATGCEKNELRIFDPPYLSAGPRPVITAPATEGTTMTVAGANVTINFSGASLRASRGVVLMAPGSLTHSFDSGQRYVPLDVVTSGSGTVTVAPPSNINIAQPTDYLLFLISDQGVPSVGRHVRLLPPATCLYAIDSPSTSYIEAEARSRGDGPFVEVNDVARSGGKYLRVTDGSGNHTTVPDEGKVLWFDVNVNTGGAFNLWALTNGPDANADTFWVSVDGNPDVQLTLPTPVNTWGWVKLASTISIPTGLHTLKIKVREDGALIDKIALTTNTGVTPSGLGGTGLACNNSFPPPSGNWTSADIGAVAAAGSFSQNGNQFTVTGSGADLYTAADEFRFAYQTVTGDASITARVVTLCGGTPGSCPNVWTKAAVMLRDGTAAGARNVASLLSPTAANNFRLQHRATAGASTTSGNSNVASQIPAYLRVTRVGNVFTAYYSLNGTTFTQIGTAQTIAMPSSILAGLGVTSHADGTLATAVFDNVVVTGGAPMAPGAPTNLTCVSGNGQCALSWSSVPGATGYNVKRSTTSGSGYMTIQSVTTPGFVDNTVSNGVTYYYVVTGTNAVGESGNSNQATCTPALPPPPPVPTGLACVSGNGQCALSWNASAGATSYNVKRSTMSGSGYVTIQSVPAPAFTDTTVTNGLTYYYVVSAVGPGGESADSGQVVCSPVAPMPPNPPSNLVATGGAGQASLAWADNSGNETGFKIERKLSVDPDTSFAQVGTVGANVASYLDTPLAAGAYSWRVRATNAVGDSAYSNTASATVTTPMGPPAPSNLAATITGGTTVNLTWADNSSNETGFRVERKIGAGAYTTLASKAVNATSHNDTPVSAGNTYTYRVIATGSPESGPSNERVVVINNPVVDAYVRGGASANNNFGTAAVLEAKTNASTPANQRNSFLRFSIAGVGTTVSSAKLRLYGNAATTAKATNVFPVADVTWGETTVNWNTPTTNSGGPTMGAQLATQTVAIAAAYVEWDITAYVQAQKTAGATLISLGVKSGVDSTNGQTTFNSREGTNKPMLVISSQ